MRCSFCFGAERRALAPPPMRSERRIAECSLRSHANRGL